MSTNLKKKLLAKGLEIGLFSFILPAFLIFTLVMPGNSLEPSAPAAVFQMALVDKMADFPVQWVAAGGGVLAYGAGQHVDFSLVKEPFSPISHLSFEGVITGGLIIGKYAYLSQEGLGLRMIDLEAPSNPVDLGFYPLSGSTFRLANWGNLMFIGGMSDGIQIFELSSDQQSMMGQPTLVDRGIISVEESITAIAADQGKLYVATTGKEIKIYDVSDSSQILEVEGLPVTLPVRSLAVNGSHLFVAGGTDGLHVLDLSVPGKAEPVATYSVPSESLYPAGRLVYLATGSDGLHLLNAGPIGTATFNAQVAPGGSFSFSPDPININTGDTVKWTWGGGPHSATSGPNCPTFDGPGPNSWDSGVHNPPFSFQFTFNAAGSFPYFCSVHCFTGTVNVVSAGPVINMSVTPTTLNFGNDNVGLNLDQMITITNQATSNATLNGSVGSPSSPFSVQSGGGAFSLTPGQSVVVTVRFSPTATGAASDNLPITHNATNQTSPTNVALSGTGVVPGINISINPSSVNFVNVPVGQFANQFVTITNENGSTATLTGNVVELTAPFQVCFDGFDCLVNGGPFTLTPGQSFSFEVTFIPNTAGTFSANLIITHNATNQSSPTNISLSGTAVAASVVITSISGPSKGKPGGRIAIQNTVTNQGNQKASRVTVNFVLSTDTTIDGPPRDTLIGKRTIMTLNPGASSAVSTMVTLPRNVAPGSYFIGGAIIGAITGFNSNFDPTGITICLSLLKPTLLLPKNRGTNISSMPTLDWSDVNGASSYDVQVATDSKFTNIVADMTGLTDSQWAVTPALSSGTTYFWRAMADNACGSGPVSATWSFKTAP